MPPTSTADESHSVGRKLYLIFYLFFQVLSITVMSTDVSQVDVALSLLFNIFLIIKVIIILELI